MTPNPQRAAALMLRRAMTVSVPLMWLGWDRKYDHWRCPRGHDFKCETYNPEGVRGLSHALHVKIRMAHTWTNCRGAMSSQRTHGEAAAVMELAKVQHGPWACGKITGSCPRCLKARRDLKYPLEGRR